jgi:hypothetical protein
LKNARTIIDAFSAKYSESPDIDYAKLTVYCNLADAYLYNRDVASSKAIIRKLRMQKNGKGLADMMLIIAYLFDRDYDRAMELFIRNEFSVVRKGDNKNSSLRARLIYRLDNMKTNHVTSPEMLRFLAAISSNSEPLPL